MTEPPVLLAWVYAGANLITLGLFTLDKAGAVMRFRRVREDLLLSASAFGPFGALAAMILLRHKTRHLKFLLVPLFTALHLLGLLWLSGFICA